jgi:hypothetical protein
LISAADRLTAFIEERRAPIGDAPPSHPGAEWRPAGDGGWNLWDRLPSDGPAKRWPYFDRLTEAEWKAIKNRHVAEVGSDDLDSRSGGDFDPVGADVGQADDVAPTGGQGEENGDCPPVGSEPKKRKPRAKKNVIPFKLPTGGQKKASGGKQKTSSKSGAGGQDAETEWLRSLLPTAKTGDWWETPADDKGLKIKYRWRLKGGQKDTYVFRRLGKRHIQTLKEKPYERQVWLITDRIFGELESQGRADVTARISPRSLLDRVAGAEN